MAVRELKNDVTAKDTAAARRRRKTTNFSTTTERAARERCYIRVFQSERELRKEGGRGIQVRA